MYSIRQRSARLKDGRASIILLVYGKSRNTSSNKRHQKILTLNTPPCLPSEWNKEFKRYRKTVNNFKVYNRALGRVEKDCEIIVTALESRTTLPTIEAFLEMYAEIRNPKKDKTSTCIESHWNEYLKELLEEGRIPTANTMNDSLNAWKRYRKKGIGNKLPISNLTLEHLLGFTKHLQSRNNSPNTIGLRMRDLRTIYNDAKMKKKVPKDIDYPYEHYQWRHTKGKTSPHDFLLKKEWKKFKKVKLEDEDLRKDRDLFMFMVHCFGINFRDLVDLTYKENVRGDVITFVRKKTRAKVVDKIKVPITKPMREIMDRYKDDSGRIFTILTRYPEDKKSWYNSYKYRLKKFNKNLKTISEEAKLPEGKKITSYVARHTFATIMYFEDVPINIISQALGHTTEQETRNYLRSIDADKVKDIIKGIL